MSSNKTFEYYDHRGNRHEFDSKEEFSAFVQQDHEFRMFSEKEERHKKFGSIFVILFLLGLIIYYTQDRRTPEEKILAAKCEIESRDNVVKKDGVSYLQLSPECEQYFDELGQTNNEADARNYP